MSGTKPWRQKLDAHGRMRLDDGLSGGVDVTVRVARQDQGAADQLKSSGLELHSQVGDIVVGHVASAADLERIAQLPCVHEVQLARPLYKDQSKLDQGET